MKKKILSTVMAAVTAAALGVATFADVVKEHCFCTTYVSAERQYSREFTAETHYLDGVADIVTVGIKCLRIDTGTEVGIGELVSNNNSDSAVAYESISYVDCAKAVRGFGSHSAYKNGQAVVFEFTQSKKAL